jgi:hypothetical protein
MARHFAELSCLVIASSFASVICAYFGRSYLAIGAAIGACIFLIVLFAVRKP